MRYVGLLLSFFVLSACTTMKTIDASFYGPPPESLSTDVTVYVTFDSSFDVSVRCGTAAFGPVGALMPVHGCVQAKAGEPINLITPIDGTLAGKTRIVDFVSDERARALCQRYGLEWSPALGLPAGSCLYQVKDEEDLRIVWPNPCESGDLFMCHELGHVNQFAFGWIEASLISPIRHWGRSPDGNRAASRASQIAKLSPPRTPGPNADDTVSLTMASADMAAQPTDKAMTQRATTLDLGKATPGNQLLAPNRVQQADWSGAETIDDVYVTARAAY